MSPEGLAMMEIVEGEYEKALRDAVLLLLGYQMVEYESLMYKTKTPPNPFKEARERLQRVSVPASSESGTETTCESTGKGSGGKGE